LNGDIRQRDPLTKLFFFIIVPKLKTGCRLPEGGAFDNPFGVLEISGIYFFDHRFILTIVLRNKDSTKGSPRFRLYLGSVDSSEMR
jgi:hypothetical protein